MLYVPTDQLDNVKKYIGGGDALPKINRLGSKEWENTKERVKKNLREVAQELIELYAKRQKSKGYAFSKILLGNKNLKIALFTKKQMTN